ncbi:UNVERIFIED_CONTAM: hypothetical protein Sindi_1966500 [Sesamum indicum]
MSSKPSNSSSSSGSSSSSSGSSSSTSGSSSASSSGSPGSSSATSQIPMARRKQIGSPSVGRSDPEIAISLMTPEHSEGEPTDKPWLTIESTLYFTADAIRERYYIPLDYEIILPSPSDRMNRPPPGSCPISIVHLAAGLRFPLPRTVARILSRLEIGPMQLAPNSICHILSFIIIMKYFELEPDFDSFWSLYKFTTSKRSGDQGFFYLTAKPNCSFVTKLKSNVGSWKDKFFFLRPPPNQVWPFPCDWRTTKPEPKIHGVGLDDDLIITITQYQYQAKLLLTEHTLKLADSVVMDARIARMVRAKRAKRAVPPSDSQHTLSAPSEDASRSHGVRSLSPSGATPVEVASGDNDPTPEHLPRDSEEPSDPEPLIRRKSKGKQVASESSKRKRSSPRPNPSSQKKSKADSSAESENLKVVDELTAWWRETQKDLQSPSYSPAAMEGERLIPNWAISGQSSVLKTHVGKDSWELYKSTILPRDQALLAPMSYIRVEQNFAHSFSQVSAFGHHLSLKCSYWRHEKMVADKLLEEKSSKLATCEKEKVELESQKSELEAQLRELRQKVASSVESAKAEGFSAGRVAGREEYLFSEEHQHQLEVARSQGRDQYLSSDDYKKTLADTRLQGARDFLKSTAFTTAVEAKSADYLIEGFNRCISQIKKLKGFADGFDTNWTDPSLDGNLAAFPEEPPLQHNDEFAVLVEDLEGSGEDAVDK